MKTLKNEIKKLAENQSVLRNQRKTIHIVGERIHEPWKACYLHNQNRHQLRLLYATYHMIKGRDLNTFETKTKIETLPINHYIKDIEKLVEKHGKVEEELVCVD